MFPVEADAFRRHPLPGTEGIAGLPQRAEEATRPQTGAAAAQQGSQAVIRDHHVGFLAAEGAIALRRRKAVQDGLEDDVVALLIDGDADGQRKKGAPVKVLSDRIHIVFPVDGNPSGEDPQDRGPEGPKHVCEIAQRIDEEDEGEEQTREDLQAHPVRDEERRVYAGVDKERDDIQPHPAGTFAQRFRDALLFWSLSFLHRLL